MINDYNLILFFELILAAVLGMIIGFERWQKGKAAGMRTFALVSLGSALFTILSTEGFKNLGVDFDPSRIAANIVVGVGFLGAGMIFLSGGEVRGLTTAAGLWVAASLGMAVGLGFYGLALSATALVFIILRALRSVESNLAEKIKKEDDE